MFILVLGENDILQSSQFVGTKKSIYFAMVHFIKKNSVHKKAGEVFEILNAFFWLLLEILFKSSFK